MTQLVLPTSQLWGEPSLTDNLERAPSRDLCTHTYMCTHMHPPIAPHTQLQSPPREYELPDPSHLALSLLIGKWGREVEAANIPLLPMVSVDDGYPRVCSKLSRTGGQLHLWAIYKQ